jgi:hypothetical protein
LEPETCSFAHTEGEALIIENNKSRKIKEFKSKAETEFWFVESYGLVPQYLKLESTDGQTVKVDFNPSSSKSSYQDLSEEERQKLKICYLFWKNLMLARALKGN